MTPDECQKVFASLSEYLDRELPERACDEIEEHIRDCEPCIEFVESLRKSVALCRQLRAERPSAPLPEDLKERMRAALRGIPSPGSEA